MEIEPKTFRIVSLGCPKNLIDSEVMAGTLMAAGWRLVPEGSAQVCIVNTCSFIDDAAQESVDILLECAEEKKAGQIGYLVATGCLPERYKEELGEGIAEVDVTIGTERFKDIDVILAALTAGRADKMFLAPPRFLYDEETPRALSGPPWKAYLKIAEGCDNRCSYCIIPRLRGPYRSRKPQSVLAEAANLAEMGVREITLAAQDTTRFGLDRGGKSGLAQLIRGFDKVQGLDWVRILYAHPNHLNEEILKAMAASKKVVNYLDLPLQHASDKMLKAMNRKVGRERIEQLLETARSLMPDLFLRTTFMVGFPGETEADFQELVEFVQKYRFAHVGVFAFSPQEDTPAFDLKDQVPEELAEERQGHLMEIQQEIAGEIWAGMIGKEIDVLLEEELVVEEETPYTHIGRFYGQAPDIDGLTFCIADPNDKPGAIVKAKIVDASEYDLFAEKL